MTAPAPRLAALAAILLAETAGAYEAAVDATFAGQLYQVTSPFGDPIVRRRRYTETLTLRVHDIAGTHVPGGPELSAVARLRLDSDLGIDPAEEAPSREDRHVPGVETSRLDLMTAYVEGRNFADGQLGFRLGRQYVVDSLGFWSFDGARVHLATPAHLAFEAYGGAEQRGGLYLLSTSRFEADGVMRGARTNLPDEAWPAYLAETRLAPAYGFAVESHAVDFLDARLTYRKVISRDRVVAAPFPEVDGSFRKLDGARVSTEKAGLAATARWRDVGSLRASAVYDALAGVASEYGGALDARVSREISAGAEADYFLPTFDGDSIWNWFAHSGTSTFQGRITWEPTRRISFAGSGGVRRFDASAEGEAQTDGLAALEGRYRTLVLDTGARASGELGERGHLAVIDASLGRTFAAGRYDAGTRLTLADWRDTVTPRRDATTFTYVLSGGLRPLVPSRVGLEWEHSMSGLVGHRMRALVTLAVTVH
jgi:hypothetical protein